MIEVARVKAAREHLPNVHFEVMPAETLACANGSMDAVISRFALMLFGNVAVSARELARVLRAGGHFSLAVWDRHDRQKHSQATNYRRTRGSPF
jgi:ubiquinone/menaquinone biosynthesis C-methylase UbiE